MNEFKVTILGSGSAVPTSWHNPSSQIVQYLGKQFLIDCGEGTQMQMIRYNIRNRNLDHIFISHLHGDHFYGLIGLINSFNLMRRNKKLHIYASRDLKKLIDFQLNITNSTLNFPVEYHDLEEQENAVLYEDNYLKISTIPLIHSIAVWGFLIREKAGRRHLRKSFIKEHNPTPEQIAGILEGKDFITKDGKSLKFKEITFPPTAPRSFAYCSDTAFLDTTAEYVKGVNLLYHESTFDNANELLANQTLHSTAAQAARVAKEAGAGKLLIGHYSARFKDLELLLKEAREVFPEAYLSEEGTTYFVGENPD